MPYYQRSDRFNPKVRRWSRRFAKWFAVAAVVLVAAWLCRDVIVAPPLARYLSRQLDREVRIGGIGGNWFTGVTLDDISVSGGQSPLKSLTCARVELRYRPLAAALTELRARDLHIVLVPSAKTETRPQPAKDPLRTLMARLPKSLPVIDIAGSITAKSVETQFIIAAQLSETRLTVSSCDVSGPHHSARVRGLVLDRNRPEWPASLERLEVEAQDARVALEPWLPARLLQPIAVSIQAHTNEQGTLVVSEARLASGGSTASVSGELTPNRGDVAVMARAEAELHDLSAVIAGFPAGSAQAAASITGSLARPNVVGSALSDGMTVAGTRIDHAGVVAALNWPDLDVSSATVEMDGAKLAVHGHVDVRSWQWRDAHADLTIADAATALPQARGELHASASFAGRAWPIDALMGASGEALIQGSGLGVGRLELGEVRAALSLDDRQLALKQLTVDNGRDRFDCAGKADVSSTGIRADLTGTNQGLEVLNAFIDVPTRDLSLKRLRAQPISGKLVLKEVALRYAEPLLPQLLRLNGNASAELDIGGTLFAPHLMGTAAVEGVSCKWRNDIPAIEDANGTMRLDGRVLRVDSLSGRMGYEPVVVHGTCDATDLSAIAVDLRLSGTNALVFSDEDMRVRVSCNELSLAGPLDALRAAGRLTIAQCIWARQTELLTASAPSVGDKVQLFSFRGNALETMSFDLNVSGHDCIRLQNNLLQGLLSVDLHLKGTGAVPEPNGLIFGRDLRLTLPLTTVAIHQAEIRFPPARPFDPMLEAQGSARVQDHDLQIRAHGPINRKQDLQIEITSVPPLSEEDALLLLTTGKTSANLTGRERSSAGYGIAGKYLGKKLFHWISGPSDPEAEESFLDRFNFDIGPESRTGARTFMSEFRLNAQLRPVINYFLVGERDRYDAFNLMAVLRARFR